MKALANTSGRREFVGIRIRSGARKQFLEEAERQGITLSAFLRELIWIGWNVKQNRDVLNKPSASKEEGLEVRS